MNARTTPLLSLAFVALTLSIGCGAASSDDGVTDEGEASNDLTGSKTYHYAVGSPDVRWAPGCGVRPPSGGSCETGLFVDFTPKYVDLTATTSATVDNAAKTITVKLDTSSKSKIHSHVAPSPESVKLEPEDMKFMTYDVKLVGWKGQELWSGSITMALAP